MFKKSKIGLKEPEHVHIVRHRSFENESFFIGPFFAQVPTPDVYRGKYRDVDYNYDEDKVCDLYVDEVRQAVERAEARGRRIAIFLIESLQSCGGQIIYPKGYLKKTFE